METRTAHQLLAALRAGHIGAVELTNAAIADIEARDGAINAVVVRDFERARLAAQEADAARARGEDRPLLGLPITIKESFDVAGLPTTWGLPGTTDIPVDRDAVVVQRLKAAGAVLLGKTNVPTMLADWQSANPVYGVTRNPWDLSRTPGGSSGGAAAAVAAGFSALEFGSDLASSLRCPAAFCGVYAHKPSYGLVPTAGFAPPAAPRQGPPIDLSVLGPLARSPADLQLALEVAAEPGRLAAPRHAALAAHRVLVIDSHPLLPTAPVVREALAALASRLAAAGCAVGHASPLLPDLANLAGVFQVLLMALFDETGARGADWAKADRQRQQIAGQWRALFEHWDIVLCPAMPTAAFPLRPGDPMGTLLEQDSIEMPYEHQPLWGSLATVAGNPATSIPLGRTSDGLPIGAQAIGPLHEDRTALAFASLVEREFGGFVRPREHRAAFAS